MAKTKPLAKQAAELLAKEAANRQAAATPEKLIALLRKRRMTTAALAEHFSVEGPFILGMIAGLQERGALVHLFGEEWGVERTPANEENKYPYTSDKNNHFKFGISSDQHIGSKYFREDVLKDLYQRFIDEGCDRVFNSGNWIDGEARFNKYDLDVHGMDNQIGRMSEVFPAGINTYSVAGDDHEGWYGQREGIDIGKHAEHIMRAAGRTDWFNMGYMESFVPLVNRNTGKSAQLLVMHPGGGSAYAISYQPQKIIEALQGGEKPAVIAIGHYHKLGLIPSRNVWAVLSGCTQDQTTFMRKKRIEAHVGGCICELEQDPDTGAIVSCKVEFIQYFNRGYYENRWSHGGSVVLPDRGVKQST